MDCACAPEVASFSSAAVLGLPREEISESSKNRRSLTSLRASWSRVGLRGARISCGTDSRLVLLRVLYTSKAVQVNMVVVVSAAKIRMFGLLLFMILIF